jgi:hypothetical protein
MEEECQRRSQQRRRQVLMVGMALSVVAHIGLMIVLNLLHRSPRGGSGAGPVAIEFAVLPERPAVETQALEFEEPMAQPIEDVRELAVEPSTLSAESPTTTLQVTGEGAMPGLGAGGAAGEGTGLGGGGAGTSFFGIAARGSRFAYIVDRSASMGQGRKMSTALHELERSLQALPDYVQFFVVLFSSEAVVPPMQQDWLRARRGVVHNLMQWLRGLPPRGGTDPSGAFQLVMGLEVRPDVVYFLTDGEIPTMDAAFVADLNRQGKRVVINTIAFGDPASQDLLKEIARDSGGVYRFVPSN